MRGKQATIRRITADDFKKRGLTRDRANYVISVVRMRQELRHLLETAKDPIVVQELLCLDEFFNDTVTFMYTGPDNKPTKPKGVA